MADLSRTIQIIFEGVDNFSGELNSFAGAVEDATQPLADLGKGILALDAAIAGIAVAFGVVAVNAANEFEDSLQLVDKQLSDTGPTLQDARKDIEALALQYGANANAVAGSAAGFLAAGYDYKTSASLIDTSTQFMIASELDAETSTKALVSSLAGFRVPADEAATAAVKVGDVLNKIGDISSGSFQNIVDGFVRIAPTAKDAGLSMEEAAAAIAVIVDTGRQGEEAATALKSGLLSLLDPSSDAAGRLKELGVATLDSNGQLRSAWEIMGDVAKATTGLTDSQKLQTAAIIFGKDQAGAMNGLLSSWGQQQNYVTQMLDSTTGAVGSMAREVDSKLQLMSVSIDRSKEAWRQFQTAFGDEIKAGGQLQSLVDSLGKLGTALKDAVNAGQLDPLFAPWKEAFEGLEAVVANVAKNLPAALEKIDWSGFEDAIGGLGDTFEGMFDGIDFSTPEGLAEAIQLVVDAGTGLINTTTGIFEGLEPLFTLIGGGVKAFSELSPEVQSAAGYIFGLSIAANALTGPLKGLSEIIGAVGKGGLVASIASLGPVIASGASAFAGFKVGEKAAEWTTLDESFGKWLLSLKGLPEVITATDEVMLSSEDALRRLSNQYGIAFKSREDFSQAVKDGRLVFNEATNDYELVSRAVEGYVKASEELDVAATIEEFKKLNPELKLLADGTVDASGKMAGFGLSSEDLRDKLGELGVAWRTPQEGFLQLARTLQDAGFTEAAERARQLGVVAGDMSFDEAANSVQKFMYQLDDQGLEGAAIAAAHLAFEFAEVDNATLAAGGSVQVWDAATGRWVTQTKAAALALADAGSKTADLTEKTKENAAQLEIMNRASTDFLLGWEKIQSEERVAIYELKADIDIARIEADAERTIAAFDSMAGSFENTGEVLTELFGIWNDSSGFDKDQIGDWIEREYKIREDLAKSQITLVESEIRRMEAQTALLQRGGVEIKINSDGLEPALEAFMFAVVDKVRVQIAGSYEDFLLGCGS